MQRLGSWAALVIALLSLKIVMARDSWCYFGRETGWIMGLAMLCLAVIRLARNEFDVIGPETATMLNGYSFLAWMAILVVVGGLHIMRHRYIKEAEQR